VVLATRQAADAVVNTLERWPEIGLRPVAVLDDELDELVTEDRGLEMTRLAPMLATIHKIPYEIGAMPNLDHGELVDLLRRCSKFFRHVLVVPEVSGMTALWTTRQSRQGIIGYHVEHVFRKRGARFVKRVVDITGALAAMLLIWPLLVLIAILIKLDSAGSVLYRQIRMTRDGKCFRVLKFRSMHVDADEKLKTILDEDPALRAEYEQYHKLQNDPRITRVGKVIRRFSLDELPQLWNVLRGTLSLVGPRAYMPRELSYMRGMNHIILQNRPGITGLWQVSGRNQLSFEERLMMDVHYVLNWTPWLDLYILARTLPVVMKGEGAA
jgi:Undecaprenyl-phosphate galactose phosphotransferase WbaP